MFAWRCCTLHAVQAAQFAGVRVFQSIRSHDTRPETAAWVHFAIVEPEGVGRMEVCVGDDGDVLTNLAFVRVAETHRHHGRLRSEICQEQEALSPGRRHINNRDRPSITFPCASEPGLPPEDNASESSNTRKQYNHCTLQIM